MEVVSMAQRVTFPIGAGRDVNMMPVVMGDAQSVPDELRAYLPLIGTCAFEHGSTVYLTVTESHVPARGRNRSPGIHTDATNSLGWGGWGGKAGIWLASNDGACRVWYSDAEPSSVDHLGALLVPPEGPSYQLHPDTLYRINEYTPHESLPATYAHDRLFFRLVGPRIGAWFAAHSTPNPLGVQPQAPIFTGSKFS
jgi:hypothetical protein